MADPVSSPKPSNKIEQTSPSGPPSTLYLSPDEQRRGWEIKKMGGMWVKVLTPEARLRALTAP